MLTYYAWLRSWLWLPQHNPQVQMISLWHKHTHTWVINHILPITASLVRINIEAVLRDDSFQVPSPDAAASLKAATTMLKWNILHPSEFSSFATQLVSLLKSCFQASNSRLMHIKSESTWGHYHIMHILQLPIRCRGRMHLKALVVPYSLQPFINM